MIKNLSLQLRKYIDILYTEMDIFKDIKQIYSGRKNISNHIAIFSLLGIMILLLNNKISFDWIAFTGGYFGCPMLSEELLHLSLVGGIVIFIYSIGYIFQNAHNFYINKSELAEPSLSSFVIFVKMLPLFIYWGVIILLFSAAGLAAFNVESVLFYLYFSILICIPPFINIIYVMYARDFNLKPLYFSPLFLFEIIDKTVGPIIKLSLKLLIVCVIPAGILYFMFLYSAKVRSPFIQLGLRLGALCIGVYFSNILHYIYSQGLVKVVEEKLLDEN